ncbi:MAG: RNA-binding S4 domain-containing protein [Flavobacterium sp.]|nr:RNA-binding S4 domain-containing protein [Pedobacter sp.]
MNKSNPKKRISTSRSASKTTGNFKIGNTTKRAGYKKDDRFGDADRKKSFSKSKEGTFGDSSQKRGTRVSKSDGSGENKRSFGSKPAYKTGRTTERADAPKRSYGSKPPYKSANRNEGSEAGKRVYGSKPAYKSSRNSEGPDDRKRPYTSKPAYKSSRNSEGPDDRKRPYTSKPAYKSSRSSEGPDDRKRPYTAKPAYKSSRNSEGPDDRKRPYTSKPAYKSSRNSEGPDDRKRPYTSKPSYNTESNSEGAGDRKRSYGSKPPYKSENAGEESSDRKRSYGSKPPYKSESAGEELSDRKRSYGSKPPYKTDRNSEGFEDNRETPGSKPLYKTAGGRKVYDKKKSEDDFGSGTKSGGSETPYKPRVRKEVEFEDKKTTRSKPAFDRSENREKGLEIKKKAYGASDTFVSRSAIKSITEKEEKPARRNSFKDKDNFVKGTTFTKKSEMKGYKPRIKEGEQEQDFRFAGAGAKGKSVKVDAVGSFVSKSKSQSKERVTENELYAGGEIRINRFISNAGVSSRREADELIGAGLVSINGEVVTELGTKVKAGDVVKFNGQKLAVEAKVYIVLNKPKDAITTSDDPDGRNTVMDLFEGKMKERIFPVGRLDRNTTGVLLLTNDGELANRLMHPKHEIKKVYKATLNKNLKSTDLWTLANGVMLEDGMIKPDAIAQSDAKDKNVVGIEIHSGKNRIIHRMFEHLGYSVDKLDRVLYAGMEKGSLKRGEWRELTDKEIKGVKRIVHLR